MAEFPPNLDDGELWLPSEIFPDVGVCRHRQPVAAALRPDLSYVDDLAEKLAAFGLLDRSSLLLPSVRPNPHPSDRFLFGNGPVLRFGPAAEKNTGAGMVYDGFRPPAVPRRAASGLRPVFPFPRAKPAQVEIFGQERRGVLARQQQVPVQGPLGPVRTGGSGRECGGTGVFLPRVINNEVVAGPTKKKSSVKGGGAQQQQQQQQQRQPARSAAMGKQGMPFRPVPPEMGLPQDWSY